MPSTQPDLDYEGWGTAGQSASDATIGARAPSHHIGVRLARELCRAAEQTAGCFSAVGAMEGRSSAAAYARAAFYAQYVPYVHVETSALVRALKRLRTFKEWQANWDAEGAPEPDKEAIETASELLGYLKSYPIEPTAMLSAIGKPLLLFRYGAKEGEISVTSEGMIDFVFDTDDGDVEAEADVPFNANTLPPTLESLLEQIKAAVP